MSLLIERKTCPICSNSDKLETLFSRAYTDPSLLEPLIAQHDGHLTREDVEGGSYMLIQCRHCNLLFQGFVPNDVLAEKIYSYSTKRITESFNKRMHARFSYFNENALLVQKAAALLSDSVPYENSMLDFGMGWGFFLLMAKAHGFPVTGIEISKERRTFAEKQGILAFASTAMLTGKTFHYIHADQVLEHVAEPLAVLQELFPLLKKRGIVYLSVPDCRLTLVDTRSRKVDLFRKSILPLGHINGFTHQSLIALARRVGLRPLSRRELLRAFLTQVSPARNAQLFQAALEVVYRYHTSTSLYFTTLDP